MGLAARGQSAPVWHPMTQWSGSNLHCPGESEFAALVKKAVGGDAEAEALTGAVLLSTCSGHKDETAGVKWLRRAAEKGNVAAQLRLAEALRDGRPGPKDDTQAFEWFKRAAESGNAAAQNDLGIVFMRGHGVEKDEQQSVHWFRLASEQGLSEAQNNLAVAYDQGHGVEQSYELARQWYLKAAEQHNSFAEYRLGLLCEQGLGGEKDAAAARKWYEAAAGHGSEDAAVRLGKKKPWQAHTVDSGYFQYLAANSMLEAKEPGRDTARAMSFLQESGKLGYLPAFLRLGGMYERGVGVKKDEAKAMEYFEQARALDPEYPSAWNSIAWLCITSQDPAIRDIKKAREYATKAVELSLGQNGHDLDTLAHAYFELGEIDSAVEIEIRAAKAEPKDDFIQMTLAEYKKAQAAKAAK